MPIKLSQTWPGMVLLDDTGRDLHLRESYTEAQTLGEAIEHGPGRYIVRRPDAAIEITEMPSPSPSPSPSPTNAKQP